MARKSKSPKVFVLGWDAADWKFITPLLDQGFMPALQRVIDNGVMGNILTLDPPLSPILWTSIATGKYGDEHGILSFIEPDPETGKRRPISVHSRNVRAIWNILTKEGYKTHLCGWWPSYPAEPINGINVSNHFADVVQDSTPENWNLSEMHVHPKSEYETLKDLRIHPRELTWAHIAPFVPEASVEKLMDDKYKELLGQIAVTLAKCSSFHNVATHILETQEWDFIGLYLDAIDKASHEFMKYHPPKQKHISKEDYDIFKDVMKGFYMYHDMMLDKILELIGDDTNLIILSDHGFYSDHRRLEALPKDSMAPAFEHSPFGMICISGPGIKKDERIYGSSLLDITPTILQLFNLPVAKDMSGKVLVQAFEKTPDIKYIDTYEGDTDGDWGELDPASKDDVWGAQEALEQLIALGYVEALDEDVENMKKQMAFENKYHEARIKYSKGDYDDALKLFEELLEQQPASGKIMVRLLNGYLENKNIDGAREILAKLRANFGTRNTPYLDLLEGKLLMQETKPKKALVLLNSAAASETATAETYTILGKNFLLLREWTSAKKAFKKAISLDAENAAAYHGMCIANLRMGKIEEAIECGITAVGIRFWFPNAHYHLAESLLAAQMYEHAANAFEIALQQQPGFGLARKHLIEIYSKHHKNKERLKIHQEIMKTVMRPKITIVSGLPRSGTSMMMQMLQAGGMDILTDNIRQNDDNNPKGYMEYEAVKSLMKDNSWLKDQDGKTIKVIMQLLGALDMKCDYKIIFMERDIEEVLASQQKMLGKDSKTYDAKLKATFEAQKEKNRSWMLSQPNMEVLFVNYADVVNNPQEQIERLGIFLDGEVDKDAMRKAVDASLYRNKNEVSA